MKALQQIFPSIYSANHGCLISECQKIENLGFQTLHVDIQDGICSSEISFGIKLVKVLRENSKMVFDIHLMLYNLEQYLPKLAGLEKVRSVTFHPRDTRFPARIVTIIKNMGYKVGLALSLGEPIEEYRSLSGQISSILVCTALVDGEGNRYRVESEDYIRQIKKVFSTQDIVVDGDINSTNLAKVMSAGANHFVIGREIFHSDDLLAKINELEKIMDV